jgi:hypothetical protein
MFSSKIATTYKQLADILNDFKTLSHQHPAIGFLINSKVKRFYRKNADSIIALEKKQKELTKKHFELDQNGNPKLLKSYEGNPKGFIHKNINDRSGYDRELIQFLKTPVTIYE